MFRYFFDIEYIDFIDPFDILPIEKVITYLGERR